MASSAPCLTSDVIFLGFRDHGVSSTKVNSGGLLLKSYPFVRTPNFTEN